MITIRGQRRTRAAREARALAPTDYIVKPLALAAIVALAGCAVGPNFRSPDAPTVKAYTADAHPDTTTATDAPTGDAQKFLEGSDVPDRWWTTFVNNELDRRVTQAIQHSPTIASAQAALRQAEESANA
ncbi:MAG TPA: hypothetical protein VF407_01630, partial [Polyangiaceae bacterium]